MRSSRREFLTTLGASALLLAGGPVARFVGTAHAASIALRGREVLMLCDSPTPPLPHTRSTVPGMVRALDVASGEVSTVDVGFLGHTVNQRTAFPQQVVTFEKLGQRGALVDIRDKKVLASIQASEGREFFGHAIFNQDGSRLICTEQAVGDVNSYETETGRLIMRDTASMKVLYELSSYGKEPHECRSYDQGKTIIVANGGDRVGAGANCSWVEVESGKLLNKVDLKYRGSRFSHLDLSHDGWVCVTASAARGRPDKPRNLIVFISPSGQTLLPKLPKDIRKKIIEEALSVAFLGASGLVAVTIPQSGLLLLIDYKTQQLVDAVAFERPVGVVPDLDPAAEGRGALVSLRSEKRLVSVVAKGDGPAQVSRFPSEFGGNGSHMTRVYI